MIKFEIGKKYFDTSACNHETIFTVEIISRTEKTVTYIHNGKKQRRSKLHIGHDGNEMIIPDSYSMAPVFRAIRELPDEDEQKAGASPAATEPQEPAEQEGPPVIYIGQRIYRDCGCMIPIQHGTIFMLVKRPATKWNNTQDLAVVRWDGTDETPASTEPIEIKKIHRPGWRSANGSGIGCFVKE